MSQVWVDTPEGGRCAVEVKMEEKKESSGW